MSVVRTFLPPSGTVVPCARPGRESPNGQGTRLPEMGTGRVSGGVGLSDHRMAGVIVRRLARGTGEGFLYRATLHVCTSTRRVHGSVRTRPDSQHVTLLGQEIRNITSSSAIMRNTAVSAPHHTQHCVRSSIASPRHEAATVRSSVEVFAQVWSDDLRMPSVSHGFISLTVRTYQVPDLWTEQKTWSRPLGSVSLQGGRLLQVRCPAIFEGHLFVEALGPQSRARRSLTYVRTRTVRD